MWVWDYKINKDWKPKTDDAWQWFMVRKINYGDFTGITKVMLKKYFPKIKKWLDLGKKTMVENFLQR